MSCEPIEMLLGAYGDGELDASQAAQVRTHLESCAACRLRLEAQGKLSRRMKDDLYERPPAAARARLENLLRDEPLRPARPWRWVPAMAAALLLTFCAGWLAANWSARAPAAQTLAQEMLTAHIQSLGGRLLDVESTDQHTVRPWFAGKADVAPPVADLSDAGFKLLGGRLEHIGSDRAAAIVYQYRKHVINLFVAPAHGGEPSGIETIRGFNFVRWQSRDLAFTAISDMESGELEKFAGLIRARVEAAATSAAASQSLDH